MITLVQQYFSESAKKYPNKIALSCQSDSVTFKEADEFSNSFARHLMELGVERGSFIPFFMKKSVSSALSILSTLKADCAYIPVDVNSPSQRLKSILQSCAADLIIVNNDSEPVLKALLGGEPTIKVVNIEQHLPTETSKLEYKNLSTDIAYVLYTSGSTGVPKGVMIPHKAIIDYIEWCVGTYSITNHDVIANHAPLYFDNSTFDLYTAFKSGASLHLVHDELNAVIPRLVSWIKERQISVFFCVPSVLTMLLKSRRLKPDSFDSVKHLICAGEVLPKDTLVQWMMMYPHIQFTNMYGPTEITVDCSFHMVHELPADDCLNIPIGKPRNNMELFIRTEDGQLTQQPNVKGELLVRGTSVAYGYLGDKTKSQAVFIQNPSHDLYHDPLYCTGDLVTIDDNGNFIFLGRADDQIKYLGYRIELGEIEASLINIDGVSEGVVVFNESEEQSQRAIGALVNASNDIDASVLTRLLQEKLPNYMVPTVIKMTNKDYPRTPNGKYNRKAILSIVFPRDPD